MADISTADESREGDYSDTIDKLNSASDQELMKHLGLSDTLKDARKHLSELAALKGKARSDANERVEKMLQPHVYPGDFKYIVESAKAKAAGKDHPSDMILD